MLKTIEDPKNLKGLKVLVRVDFNVPQKGGVIRDDNRIRAALPTINYLVNAGAKVILMSHLGKIKWKEPDPAKIEEMKAANDMAPIAARLGELVAPVKVSFSKATRGEELANAVAGLKDGEILVVQNTRYEKGEEKNDEALAKEWAALADAYVLDAFGSSHRAHASTVGVPAILKAEGKPVAEGYLMIKEVDNLTRCVEVAKEDRPYIAILGGFKVSDKIKVIDSLLKKCSSSAEPWLIPSRKPLAKTSEIAQFKMINSNMPSAASKTRRKPARKSSFQSIPSSPIPSNRSKAV